VKCILCNKSDLEILCTISTIDLCSMYSLSFLLNISNEFNGLRKLDFILCNDCDLRFFFPSVTGSIGFYDALSKIMDSRYYQENKLEYAFAESFISNKDRVLDVGSGCGMFSSYVSGEYTGLDFNPAAVEQAKRDGVRVLNESVQAHAAKTSLPYTVVTAFQVLEHVSDPDRFIDSCLSILLPGGLLILSVPSEDSFISLLENAVINMPPHHISRWTDNCLINLQKLFNIKLVALEHQALEKIHFETFVEGVAHRIVRSVLHWNSTGLIDTSYKKKIINRVSRYLKPLVRKIYCTPALWPIGHSVTAVFRK
jgi:2-polyprenyl-3-methyl-5-hydroxy-6-metoxy-1,4-benzoquinol methylase